MAKLYFNKTVRYDGTTYFPNTVFEVKDGDVADLKQDGAFVIEEPVEPIAINEHPIEVSEVIEEKPKREIDILREKADALGVKYKPNWGVKKLTEVLSEVEKE